MQTTSHLNIVKGLSVMAAVFSTPLMAHPGNSGPGLLGNLLHPFTGLDHLLVVVVAAVVAGLYIKARSRSR